MKKSILSSLVFGCLLTCSEVIADDMVRIPTQGDTTNGYTACPIESLKCQENHDMEGSAVIDTTSTCKLVNTCKAENIQTISIDAFYIDALPVTNADLKKCIDENRCTSTEVYEHAQTYGADPSKLLAPAVVGYDMAQEYCAFVGKKLPTEAQWLAAAMGNQVKKYTWGDEELATASVNISLYQFSKLENVGTMPTDFIHGIYDMSGNGYEWIQADLIEAVYPDGAACIARNSRPCLGAAPLPLYQRIGIDENDAATFRCVKSAE